MECTRGLAMRILSVRPSVCLSVKRVDCDKTEERSTGPRWSEIADFEPIFARSASAVTT